MRHTRREFLGTGAAALGAITLLPYTVHADGHSNHTFKTSAGPISVNPVSHASFVMETPVGTIYADPVGDVSAYSKFPKPDLILVTHHHGDHYKPDTLAALAGENTQIIVNPEVNGKLPADLAAKATQVANGGSASFKSLGVDAIPAYNLTADRRKYHPQGRDNGYVLNFDGFRVYISGDTEDVPEMRSLKDISLAFVCMNLPFTMDAKAAASAVKEFKPKYVYPYHYRGKDGGTQNPEEFAKLLGGASEAKMGDWY